MQIYGEKSFTKNYKNERVISVLNLQNKKPLCTESKKKSLPVELVGLALNIEK